MVVEEKEVAEKYSMMVIANQVVSEG